MKFSWSRFPRVLLISALLAGAGCNQAHATPPQGQAQAQPPPPPTADATALPPLATAQLPPLPVPATFDVAALAERVKPQVVNITTTERIRAREMEGMDPFDFFFGPNGPRGRNPHEGQKRQSAGTGFIIDASGYVMTNEHVVHDADDVRVRLADEREFKADVVGRDPKLDLALLRIQGAKDLPAAPLGSSDQLRVGEHVLAVGNPFGLGHTVTLGIVSAKARTIGAGPYDDFIQTDASINPGNSGGPLFNWRGEVVGINTAIRKDANGIGFAIPIDAVKEVLPQLREKGRVARGRLGIGFQPITPDLAAALGLDAPRGALVSEIEPGGAAARAGLRAGDVVTAVNGTPVGHAEELPRRVARNAPGSTVKVTFLRDKKQHEVSAKLDTMPDDSTGPQRSPRAKPMAAQGAGKPNINVSDADGGGVRVDDVTDTNIRDLMPGDVIIEAEHKPVRDTQQLRAAIAKVRPGGTALVKIRRGRLTQFAGLPVPAK